jgi:ribosome maturation factor RimP
MTATSEIDRVRELVAPIASDLQLDLYDIERRGGTIRVTLDTVAGSEQGITLDELSLATRLISREMDHADPIPGRYTLEVTSPGLERPLRSPAHFRREVGKEITVRLSDVVNDERRVEGVLIGADDDAATIRLASGDERVIPYASIDKARTVFEWGPAPKPGKGRGGGSRPTAVKTERKESP